MGASVYTVTGGNGGVGKTTTVLNLGIALQQAGESALAIDCDLEMPNLGQYVGLDQGPKIHQVLADEAPVRDAVANGPGDLSVLAGDHDLEAFAKADPKQLRDVFYLVTIAYDTILVDTSPGFKRETNFAHSEADGTILVMTPDDVAVENARRARRFAANSGCPVTGVITQRCSEDDCATTIADRLNTTALGSIPEHPNDAPIVPTATAPASDAATAYREAAVELPATQCSDTSEISVPDHPIKSLGDHNRKQNRTS